MKRCPFCGSGDIAYLGIDDGGGDFGTSLCDVYRCHDCRSAFEDFSYDTHRDMYQDDGHTETRDAREDIP